MATTTPAALAATQATPAGQRGGFTTDVSEVAESLAQVGSFAIDEISQILHALDSPWFTAMIPVKVSGTTVNVKFTMSTLRFMGMVYAGYVIHQIQTLGWEKATVVTSVHDKLLSILDKAEAYTPGANTIFSGGGSGGPGAQDLFGAGMGLFGVQGMAAAKILEMMGLKF
jgi:hypothetical protein